ncbi:MAG: hypothetical protein WCB85_03915 [Candidatus Dormiibacterota bacterium]
MRAAADLPNFAPIVAEVVILEVAVGTAALSYLVDLFGRVGRGFVGTTALICAALMGLDLIFLLLLVTDPGRLLGSNLSSAAMAAADRWAIAFTGLLLLHALFCAIGTDPARWVIGAVELVVGVLAVVAVASALGPGLGGTGSALAAFLPAALLAGSVVSGMLLGHWYLISPSLSFRPLRQAAYLIFAAVAVQAVVIVAALLGAAAQARAALVGPDYGLPFWALVVGAGIAATAGVNVLTLHFARIRANQPATAMLYALIVTVVMGVIPAHLIFFLTSTPV